MILTICRAMPGWTYWDVEDLPEPTFNRLVAMLRQEAEDKKKQQAARRRKGAGKVFSATSE